MRPTHIEDYLITVKTGNVDPSSFCRFVTLSVDIRLVPPLE